MGAYESEDAVHLAPGPGDRVAVATSGSTAAVEINSGASRLFWFVWVPDTAGSGHVAHVRFGLSGIDAAATDDLVMEERMVYKFRCGDADQRSHMRAISVGGDGDIHWVEAS